MERMVGRPAVGVLEPVQASAGADRCRLDLGQRVGCPDRQVSRSHGSAFDRGDPCCWTSSPCGAKRTPPEAPSAPPPKGAPLAARQSRFRGGRLPAPVACDGRWPPCAAVVQKGKRPL